MKVRVQIIAQLEQTSEISKWAASDGSEVMTLITNDMAAAKELEEALLSGSEITANCFVQNPRLTYKYQRKEKK